MAKTTILILFLLCSAGICKGLRSGMPNINMIQTVVTQAVAGLAEKIDIVENNLAQKVDALQATFEKRLTRIEQNVLSTQTVCQFYLDNQTNFQADWLGKNVTAESTRSKVKVEILNDLQEMQREQTNVLRIISSTVEKSLNTTKEILVTMERNSQAFQSQTGKQANLSEINYEPARGELSSSRLWITTTSIPVGILEKSKNLTSDIGDQNESKTARSSPASKHLAQNSLTKNLRSILVQIVASRVCEKGMLEFLNYNLPYPLTYPSKIFDFPYPCDTNTDGGGWIVIQRRATGDVSFNRMWDEYKHGFGSFAGDFWLGNDKIHTISKSGRYELRIDMVFNGASVFAHYDNFSIEAEGHRETQIISYKDRYYGRRRRERLEDVPMGYKLSLGAYDGTAGDSMRDNVGRPFSTSDQDRDSSDGNCAEQYNGGWWFVGCGYSCLNGEWGADSQRGVEWRDLTSGLSVSFSEMKIRRVS